MTSQINDSELNQKDSRESGVINQSTPPSVPAYTSAQIPAANQAREPNAEFWDYTGIDSTSVNEITIIVDDGDDRKRKAVATWEGGIRKKKKDKKTVQQLIDEGIAMVKEISSEANRLINVAHKNFAERAISIGLICVKLKELIRGTEKPWGAWAEENLSFVAKRNREKYMLIASRPDCWPFSFLGVDRMELLCSVTKETEGDDRIGDLLKKYQIPFSDDSEVNMGQFKALIDAAINNERLLRSGLAINFNLVTNIVNLGIDFDRSMIKRLSDIRECGGRPEALLEKLALTSGKEEMNVTPEKRLQDFNHLTNRLIKTIDFIIDNQDQLDKIDRDTFQLLLEKLVKIQDMGIAKAENEQD